MQENTNKTVKGKMPVNTKILIAILAVLVIGGGYALAAPSLKEAQQQKQQKQAAEALFGKKQIQEWENMTKGKKR